VSLSFSLCLCLSFSIIEAEGEDSLGDSVEFSFSFSDFSFDFFRGLECPSDSPDDSAFFVFSLSFFFFFLGFSPFECLWFSSKKLLSEFSLETSGGEFLFPFSCAVSVAIVAFSRDLDLVSSDWECWSFEDDDFNFDSKMFSEAYDTKEDCDWLSDLDLTDWEEDCGCNDWEEDCDCNSDWLSDLDLTDWLEDCDCNCGGDSCDDERLSGCDLTDWLEDCDCNWGYSFSSKTIFQFTKSVGAIPNTSSKSFRQESYEHQQHIASDDTNS